MAEGQSDREPAPECFDVVVVGSGNAGFCAALSAKEHGASSVLLLEKAPKEWAGGNTTFTAGAFRTVFDGLDDVLPLVHNVTPDMVDKIDMEPYTREDFMADIMKVTSNRSDPELAKKLVDESNDTVKWLARNGIKFDLSFHRQAYEINGRQKFWGGMVLAVRDGGKGLTRQYQSLAASLGITVRYSTAVERLLHLLAPGNPIGDVVVTPPGASTPHTIHAHSTVLCAGGFEASPALRRHHLGRNWDLARVRGTPYNTGSLLTHALSAGAAATPDWRGAGCHATCWDAAAPPDAGDPLLTNQLTKSGYPLGLMLNSAGARFVDEGADLRNYTYAAFGRAVLRQPGAVAFQVWDADGAGWLRREEYGDGVVERVVAGSVEELAAELAERKGLREPEAFVRTVQEYNEAAAAFRRENPEAVFDPSRKDGLSTRSRAGGLELDKTNWATPLVRAPFTAVKITCGITFTFGGLKVDPETSGVIAASTGEVIPGLFCAGEMLGGLFYENYPGGSGLTAGAVFGRQAGRIAATRAKDKSV